MKSNKVIIIVSIIMVAFAICLGFFTIGHGIIALIIGGFGAVVLAFTLLNNGVKKGSKAARWCRRILVLLLILGFAVFGVLEYNVISGSKQSDNAEAPYLIVLGAQVNGEDPSMILSERLNAAYEYMNQYPDSIAILSGGKGQGEDITEAQAMENWLTRRGIDESRLIKEESSTDTWENIEYSLEKIISSGEQKEVRAAIVTNDFHMFRSVNIAKQYGIDAVSFPAETQRIDLKINYYIREALALVKMYFK